MSGLGVDTHTHLTDFPLLQQTPIFKADSDLAASPFDVRYDAANDSLFVACDGEAITTRDLMHMRPDDQRADLADNNSRLNLTVDELYRLATRRRFFGHRLPASREYLEYPPNVHGIDAVRTQVFGYQDPMPAGRAVCHVGLDWRWEPDVPVRTYAEIMGEQFRVSPATFETAFRQGTRLNYPESFYGDEQAPKRRKRRAVTKEKPVRTSRRPPTTTSSSSSSSSSANTPAIGRLSSPPMAPQQYYGSHGSFSLEQLTPSSPLVFPLLPELPHLPTLSPDLQAGVSLLTHFSSPSQSTTMVATTPKRKRGLVVSQVPPNV